MLTTDRITRFDADEEIPTKLTRIITLPDSRQVEVIWMPAEIESSEDGIRTLAWADTDHPPVCTPVVGPDRWMKLVPDTVTTEVARERVERTAVEVSDEADLKPGKYLISATK